MPNNYILLEKIVVPAAGASSVTFANIPQTGYTDLVVKCSTRNTGAGVANYHNISFNGSAASFSGRFLEGSGTAASSGTTQSAGIDDGGGATASTFANTEYYIPNYTSANNKSYSVDSVTETNATAAFMSLVAGLWSNTAAITSIGITPQSGSLAANSTFYLYGVAKLGTTPTIAPKATGGDVIDTDGTYWYHIFRSSGTFTPAVALTCDYLVVAGGGGGGYEPGGNNQPGGGGAGGMRCTVTGTGGSGSLESALSLASGTNYTVTIGAGGSRGASGITATSGADSVFSTITSTGGGRGVSVNAGGSAWTSAADGGSGGGGGGGVLTGGAASPSGQGFAGGTTSAGGASNGSGGGGAASAGASNTGSQTNVAGGSGRATTISGSSVTYAAGGNGGGAGGTAGAANTGNGGFAGGSTGGNGGSGIVIVRYLVA